MQQLTQMQQGGFQHDDKARDVCIKLKEFLYCFHLFKDLENRADFRLVVYRVK